MRDCRAKKRAEQPEEPIAEGVLGRDGVRIEDEFSYNPHKLRGGSPKNQFLEAHSSLPMDAHANQ